MATVALLLYLLFLALAVERARPATGGRFAVPAWWLPGALCVHRHESTDWHIVNPPYSGGMQFTTYTWQSVGGRGIAAWASPAEQLYRAWLVWRRDGGSWREWPNTSRMCGLH